ncbi:MAG: hypothetical protein LBS86_08100 [Treponema sp.]|nr:hypothetical protein [Treponema sp.]
MKTAAWYAALTALAVSFASCVGESAVARLEWEPPPPEPRPEAAIIAHQNMAEGASLPVWVSVYDKQGVKGLEALSLYNGNYLLVAKNQGNNFKSLSLWLEAFSIAQDVAGLIATRIQERFTNAASTYPSAEYGGYFEAVVKAAFDAEYRGALREDSYWLLKQHFAEDGVTPQRETYDFLVLVSINKATLVSQINALLDSAIPDPPLTTAQASAVSQLRAVFYNQF